MVDADALTHARETKEAVHQSSDPTFCSICFKGSKKFEGLSTCCHAPLIPKGQAYQNMYDIVEMMEGEFEESELSRKKVEKQARRRKRRQVRKEAARLSVNSFLEGKNKG